MDAMECLKTRRSVRSYKTDPIDRATIEDIVDCGRLAATGMNLQPWEFVVITDPDMRRGIADITEHGKFIADAPCCIAIICENVKYFIEDAKTKSVLDYFERIRNVYVNQLRFSKTWNCGDGSITLRPNENELYLVVAATPGVLVPQPFQVNFIEQERFPYEVKLDGTIPMNTAYKFDLNKSIDRTAPNGGGFVQGRNSVAPTAYVGRFAKVLDPGGSIKCEKGVFTGFVGQRECDKATNYGGMLASYNFNSPHDFLVRDGFASGDGITHGNPKWTRGQLGFLGFNGKDQYAEMPSYLCDLRNAEIEVKVQWLGSKPGERVFDFGQDKDNCMYFTPESETGKGAFVMISGGKNAIIETKDPIANGDWNKVTVSFAGDTATLSLNGEVVGTATMPAKPENLRADSNYPAKGRDGSFFTGNLDFLIVRIKDYRDTY